MNAWTTTGGCILLELGPHTVSNTLFLWSDPVSTASAATSLKSAARSSKLLRRPFQSVKHSIEDNRSMHVALAVPGYCYIGSMRESGQS